MIPLEIDFHKEYVDMGIMWQVQCHVISVDSNLNYTEYAYSWVYGRNVIKFAPCKGEYDVWLHSHTGVYEIKLKENETTIFNFDTESQADTFIEECKAFMQHYNETVLHIIPFHIEIQSQFTLENNS